MTTNLYQSAEIRWFLAGDQQFDALLTWFQNELPLIEETDDYVPQPKPPPFVKKEKVRPDKYLQLTDCTTVGVKLRNGRLEIKGLVVGPRSFSLAEAVGRVDQWVRWSLKPSAAIAEPLQADVLKEGQWTEVVKTRYTQKYDFDSDRCAAVSPDAWPAVGCNVELTLLKVKAEIDAWVTLGFEAFGPSARVMAILDEAVRYFFDARVDPPVQLEERDSLNYPAWLAVLSP